MSGGNGEQDRRDGIALDALPRWLRDLIDLNDETAGRDTGRAKRFLVSGEDMSPKAREKKQRNFDELLRLLQNPAYAQLYREAAETIRHLDDAADRAKRKLAKESELAAERLDTLKHKAAELPDGRKVFRSKDGRLVAEDGTDVTVRQDAIKRLSSETPTWEEFRDAQKRLAEIQRQQSEIDDYVRDVIDPARERLADTDHPLTPEELRELRRSAEEAAPPALRAEYDELLKARTDAKTNPSARSAAAGTYVGPAGLDAPELLGQFRAASTSLNEDAFAPPSPDASMDSEVSPAREPYGSQATSLPARAPKI